VNELKTIEYITYMATYKLEEATNFDRLVNYGDLKSPWPLDLYQYDELYKLVCPKYPVV
jgi:hypothetical protein